MNRVAFFIFCLLVLIPGISTSADAAPPRQPEGSNLIPGEETNVQMAAENVVLAITRTDAEDSGATITADFQMRNLGSETESMMVRFPMENVNGNGDGYGRFPQITSFSVSIDGNPVQPAQVKEPFKDGPAISWSVFPVTFPPGQDVMIRVTYATTITRESSYRFLSYILETGAGWSGPIGYASITYRFPYAVSPANVVSAWPGSTIFVGREMRFVKENFEPNQNDNPRIIFVDPAEWQTILDLEAYTGEQPKDVSVILRLADKYLELSYLHNDCRVNPEAIPLAETIVAQGITYSPNSASLHAEMAKIAIQDLKCYNFPAPYPIPPRAPIEALQAKIQREIDIATRLDPNDALLLEVKAALAESVNYYPDFLSSRTPTPENTGTSPATPRPSSTAWSTRTPSPTFIKSTSAIRGETTDGELNSTVTLILIGIGGFLIGVLFYWSLSRIGQKKAK